MDDKLFMTRAIMLAEAGKQSVFPNPMVGCVIVHENKIIGEGFHKAYGQPHAEVEAIKSVKNQDLLHKSTMFVTLEPCSHYGKTPPCTDLILEKKIPNVVIATVDPNPLVKGKGIEKLQNNGVNVKSGLLETEAINLNKRFFTYHQKKRPYIILKWAESKDGFIDKKNRQINSPINWISNPYTKQLVHKWRAEEQAILIGSKTALLDNPFLTTRHWYGNNPIRILIDEKLEVPLHFNIYQKSNNSRFSPEVICFHDVTVEPSQKINHCIFYPINFKNNYFVEEIIKILYDHHIISLIVEGGRQTLETFIQSNLWDEARIIKGNKMFNEGIPAPELNLKNFSFEKIMDDVVIYYTKN